MVQTMETDSVTVILLKKLFLLEYTIKTIVDNLEIRKNQTRTCTAGKTVKIIDPTTVFQRRLQLPYIYTHGIILHYQSLKQQKRTGQ